MEKIGETIFNSVVKAESLRNLSRKYSSVCYEATEDASNYATAASLACSAKIGGLAAGASRNSAIRAAAADAFVFASSHDAYKVYLTAKDALLEFQKHACEQNVRLGVGFRGMVGTLKKYNMQIRLLMASTEQNMAEARKCSARAFSSAIMLILSEEVKKKCFMARSYAEVVSQLSPIVDEVAAATVAANEAQRAADLFHRSTNRQDAFNYAKSVRVAYINTTAIAAASIIAAAAGHAQYLGNLIQIGIFNICYCRGLFPEEYFNHENSVPTLEMKIKKLMPHDADSVRLIDWMERGVFDALLKKYLKTLLFCVCEGMHGPMVEEYSCQLMTAQKMPEERTILMKLRYYDGVTPADYEPPFFHCCTKEVKGVLDNAQDPVESEQQLHQVKEWISHHDTFELMDALLNFPDIPVVLIEEVIDKLVMEGVLSRTEKLGMHPYKDKNSEHKFPIVKKEIHVLAPGFISKTSTVKEPIHQNVRDHTTEAQ